MGDEKHIRSINQVIKHFKEKDQHTAVSRALLISLIEDGKIPASKIGNRTIVVQEDVIDYFNNMGKSNEKN